MTGDTASDEALFQQATRAYEGENLSEALRLFTLLADRDHPEACQYLGLMYRTGDGVPKDESKAAFWYSKHTLLLRRLAESGDLDALVNLGKLYQYGQAVTADHAKAVAAFEKAANASHAGAQFHLASLYKHGWCSLPHDEVRYHEWLALAAKSGHPEALYLTGLELIHDRRDDAIKLIKRAADSGFWPACDYLASH